MDCVVALGCIVCLVFHDAPDSSAEIHDIDGKTCAGAHFRTIGLCVPHHRHGQSNGPFQYATWHGPGKYAGKAIFEQRYCTEENLLVLVKDRLL